MPREESIVEEEGPREAWPTRLAENQASSRSLPAGLSRIRGGLSTPASPWPPAQRAALGLVRPRRLLPAALSDGAENPGDGNQHSREGRARRTGTEVPGA